MKILKLVGKIVLLIVYSVLFLAIWGFIWFGLLLIAK
jgi:hypothetical protein